LSASESWENKCCRCENDVKETLSPGKRACHVTCGPCLYPDNPNCVSCEIVGHCRLALDFLKNVDPEGFKKGSYFTDQLSGEETLYHTLDFVNAQQNLVNTLGERKYLDSLERASKVKAQMFIDMKNLVKVLKEASVNPEKVKEILMRTRERNLILAELVNRGASTVRELSDCTGIEKPKLLRHLTALNQDGKVKVAGEQENQLLYNLP